MKKKMLSLAMAMMMIAGVAASAPVSVQAAERQTVEIDVSGDVTKSIRKALADYETVATPENQYEFIVPAGTYTLTQNITIYSNEHLKLDGVTFIKGDYAGSMLRVGRNTDPATGYDYYQNISVTGGTFDANATTVSKKGGIANFDHTTNLVFNNVTFKNCRDSHHLTVAGCKNVTVNNCTFSGFYRTENKNVNMEAIQFDVLEKEHYTGRAYDVSYDGLGVENVTVRNCKFSNVNRGVGAHSVQTGTYMRNVKILNNTFTGIGGYAITCANFIGATISNNVISNSGAGILFRTVNQGFANTYYKANQTVKDTGSTISNNTISLNKPSDNQFKVVPYGIKAYGIKTGSSNNGIPAGDYQVYNLKITGNKITMNSYGYGIWLTGACKSQITSNTVSVKKGGTSAHPSQGVKLESCNTASIKSNKLYGNSVANSGNGLYLVKAKSITASSNKISKFSKNGICVDTKSSTTLKSNTISSCKENGIVVRNSSSASISGGKISSNKQKGIYVHPSAKKVTIKSVKCTGNKGGNIKKK